MRKQLDNRIPTLINNNVKLNHRSFIVLVGDRGRDQIVNLHFLLSQARVSARPSVLWCYKKDLGFTTHRKKREAKIKRDVKRGIREPNEQDPFEVFVTVTDIRYTYYKDSPKILGQTFGMLILQDFEAITPNLLARTIETVEGGGLVVLLLRSMGSLRQLYGLSMDVHQRYRTSSHAEIVPRFNERFILSLGACADCLVLDDELNVLPISRGKDIVPLEDGESERGKEGRELKELKASLEDTKPAGDLIKLTKTTDQARALLTFLSTTTTASTTSRSLSTTTSLTAARGRGKSATLGLAVAGALVSGYANVFVTSPDVENLGTFWEFLMKGLEGVGWEEGSEWGVFRADVDISKEGEGAGGGGEKKKGVVVRVEVWRGMRQVVQYIQPTDSHTLLHADLLIIDEAAAIPLPVVKALLGPYEVWMASTINGYEGTGRSLSLKLLKGLRDASASASASMSSLGAGEDDAATAAGVGGAKKSKLGELTKQSPKVRTLREVKLETPIRYSPGDGVERWLNSLLCLDASYVPRGLGAPGGCPHPDKCELYYVNRDTLFSYHPASEVFLQRMMSLYVASHYKNQPNDLQLLSDAPAHHLFVLLPPISPTSSSLPEPLVVLQVALEGRISKDVVMEGLGRGVRSGGDMVPWVVSGQFLEGGFGSLSGGRVVRVAVCPEYANMGYGSKAIRALDEWVSGECLSLDEEGKDGEGDEEMEGEEGEGGKKDGASTLLSETISVKSINKMPPLLQRLSERKPEVLDYLSVSYGLTAPLLRFWKRAGFVPLYVRQTASELTGEHTCVMVKGLKSSDPAELGWLREFARDFRKRFLSLLSYKFREFGSVMGLSVLEAVNAGLKGYEADRDANGSDGCLTSNELSHLLSPFDLKRLESYANNMLDYHVILDLVPTLAGLYFQKRLDARATGEGGDEGEAEGDKGAERKEVKLSAVQSSILLAVGLQRKSVEDVEKELQIPVSQGLALFVKIIRKITNRLIEIQRESVARTVPDVSSLNIASSSTGAGSSTQLITSGATKAIREELDEAGDEEVRHKEKEGRLREKQREMISSLDLRKYAIDNAAVDWNAAEEQVKALEKAGKGKATIISVKSTSTSGAASGQKRKADEVSGSGGKEGKKTRRGGTGKKIKH